MVRYLVFPLLGLLCGCQPPARAGTVEQAALCDPAATCASTPVPVPPAARPCPAASAGWNEWDLWRGGTCLRGANTWQERIAGRRGWARSVYPPYLRADFEELRRWGANLVVISHPGIFRERPPYVLDPVVLAHLESLVSSAAAERLFVVIAFRTGPGRDEKLFETKTRPNSLRTVWNEGSAGTLARRGWARMWSETARRFQHHRNVVGYELMVEPDSSPRLWTPLANEIADSIRNVDSETPILIGGARWSTACTLWCLTGIRASRVVYTVHQYKPEDYSHQNPPGNTNWTPDPLRVLYEGIWGFSRSRNVPVAFTEYGLHWRAPQGEAYLTFQFDLIERMGANHALWLWETRAVDVGYDSMDFRKNSTGVLVQAIRKNWEANSLRP